MLTGWAILRLLGHLLTQQSGDETKGNETFDEQCGSCHSAYTAETKKGPSLQFLFAKERLESNGKTVSPANVMEKIERGGKGMPGFKETLSAADKSNLMAYLKTL